MGSSSLFSIFFRPLLLGSLLLMFTFPCVASSLSDEGVAELDNYLEGVIATTHIPGVVALVVNKDGVVYEKAFGLMDSANDKPMATDAIFRLASMTKSITSVAVMMLVEEGKVALDDPISDFLPELGNREVFTSFDLDTGNYTSTPAKIDMTIRHLLTHTSGLGYSFVNPTLSKALGDDYGLSVTILPLLFEPGTQWNYGEGTRVLGHLVERVSGQDLYEFMRERIFEPLAMEDIYYAIPAEKNHRTVTVHRLLNGVLVESPNATGVLSSPTYGDGGLSSTARDYGRFIRMFLNDGSLEDSGQLLSLKTVQSMGENHIGNIGLKLMKSSNSDISLPFPTSANIDTYGLGFQISTESMEDMRSPGSMSWSGIFNTAFWIDPEKEIGVVLLMQLLPFYDDVAIDVLQGLEHRIYQNLE